MLDFLKVNLIYIWLFLFGGVFLLEDYLASSSRYFYFTFGPVFFKKSVNLNQVPSDESLANYLNAKFRSWIFGDYVFKKVDINRIMFWMKFWQFTLLNIPSLTHGIIELNRVEQSASLVCRLNIYPIVFFVFSIPTVYLIGGLEDMKLFIPILLIIVFTVYFLDFIRLKKIAQSISEYNLGGEIHPEKLGM